MIFINKNNLSVVLRFLFCLLINIMVIIIFILTYAWFLIFVSIYGNLMHATIKKKGQDEY